MNEAASVHSIEALYEWHAALCVFRTEALEALASVSLEIQRADAWLDDQLRHWQRAARDAEEEVVRAKTELFNRRFPDYAGRIPDCSVQEEALWAAEDRLQHAHDQIAIVRQWYQRMPKMISEAYDGPSRHLANFLEAELPRGLATLKARIANLEAYVNLKPEHVPSAPPAIKTLEEPK